LAYRFASSESPLSLMVWWTITVDTLTIVFDFAATSAPCSISTFIAAACPWSAAHINGVVPRRFSLALTSAPAAINVVTAATLPLFAASISAVSPFGERWSTFAPALTIASTSAG
jgi:hypothetical protein